MPTIGVVEFDIKFKTHYHIPTYPINLIPPWNLLHLISQRNCLIVTYLIEQTIDHGMKLLCKITEQSPHLIKQIYLVT